MSRKIMALALVAASVLLHGCSKQDTGKDTPPGTAKVDSATGRPTAQPRPSKEITAGLDAEQQRAVAGVERLGGKVEVGEDSSGGRAIKVDLNSTATTDADLEALKPLTGLESLDLGKTKVTDAGLEHLKGLTNLQVLNLAFDDVTDAGLAHLKGLTRLQSLYLTFTKVTDKGVSGLQEALPQATITR
jgi:hypothetical protein